MPEEKCSFDRERDCLGLQKANMLEAQMKEWREAARKTHKELYDRTRDLEKSDAKREEQYETIIEKLDDLLSWKKDEQAAPGERWKAIVDKIIMLVVGAVVAFALAKVGL